MKYSIILLLMLSLAGCSTTHTLSLSGRPNTVDVVREFTPLTTTTFAVRQDEHGRPVQLVATEGTSIVDATLRLLGIAGLVWGAYWIGGHLKDVNSAGNVTVQGVP